jgi:hypothetical protein
VSQISRDHVLGVLKPIWKTKTETPKRLRGRLETVLDFAIANDWGAEPNPARWRDHLQKLLPPPSRLAPVEHHAALAHADMPAFMHALRARSGAAALALEFTILAAARTSEVLGAAGTRWISPGQSGRFLRHEPRRRASTACRCRSRPWQF